MASSKRLFTHLIPWKTGTEDSLCVKDCPSCPLPSEILNYAAVTLPPSAPPPSKPQISSYQLRVHVFIPFALQLYTQAELLPSTVHFRQYSDTP